MDAAVVRLQLPANAALLPAFDDAADKYASRRGFADGGTRFVAVAEAAVRAVASSSPSTISMTATEFGDRVQLDVVGADPSAAMDGRAIDAVTSAGPGLDVTVDAAAAAVRATVSLN